MSSGKFLLGIAGVLITALALTKLDMNKENNKVRENFWNGIQFTSGAMPAVRLPNGELSAIGGNYMAPDMMGSGKFVSTPAFQAVLSPRFSNVQYGANIKYNMPDRQNLGVPCEPLTFGSMAQENYLKQRTEPMNLSQQQVENFENKQRENYDYANAGSGQCGGSPASCGKGGYGLGHKVAGGYELPSGYKSGNYWDVYDSLPGDKIMGGELPVGTMSTMDGAGNLNQVVMVQHIMPMNNKASSRLRSQGDPIRGDLAIVPCQSGWFSVYPNIARDVQEGAMNVLAGAGGGGESYNKLMNLLVNASGGSVSTLGGVDLSESLPEYNANMATSMTTSLKNAMTDVQVSAFP
jgi:hypothetical protein